jgi:hypothetical protein
LNLDEVVVGSFDSRGREILEVYWATKDYVIFRHASGISPHFSDVDKLADSQRKTYGNIGPLLSGVNALRSGLILKTVSIDREIARAVAQALEGNVENASEILTAVRKRLLGLISTRGRLQYQLSAFVFMMIVGAVTWWYTTTMVSSTQSGLIIVLKVAVCGAIGGFLSVSMTVKTLDIDPDSDWKVNSLAGASRIIIALIGSIFIYFAIKSKLVLGSVDLLSPIEAAYALAIAAGFSETFVPNILQKVSDPDKNVKSTKS